VKLIGPISHCFICLQLHQYYFSPLEKNFLTKKSIFNMVSFATPDTLNCRPNKSETYQFVPLMEFSESIRPKSTDYEKLPSKVAALQSGIQSLSTLTRVVRSLRKDKNRINIVQSDKQEQMNTPVLGFSEEGGFDTNKQADLMISVPTAKSSGGHIPFRDSLLTRLLQGSLQKNFSIFMVTAVNSAQDVNLIRFASEIGGLYNLMWINEREMDDTEKKTLLEDPVKREAIGHAIRCVSNKILSLSKKEKALESALEGSKDDKKMKRIQEEETKEMKETLPTEVIDIVDAINEHVEEDHLAFDYSVADPKANIKSETNPLSTVEKFNHLFNNLSDDLIALSASLDRLEAERESQEEMMLNKLGIRLVSQNSGSIVPSIHATPKHLQLDKAMFKTSGKLSVDTPGRSPHDDSRSPRGMKMLTRPVTPEDDGDVVSIAVGMDPSEGFEFDLSDKDNISMNKRMSVGQVKIKSKKVDPSIALQALNDSPRLDDSGTLVSPRLQAIKREASLVAVAKTRKSSVETADSIARSRSSSVENTTLAPIKSQLLPVPIKPHYKKEKSNPDMLAQTAPANMGSSHSSPTVGIVKQSSNSKLATSQSSLVLQQTAQKVLSEEATAVRSGSKSSLTGENSAPKSASKSTLGAMREAIGDAAGAVFRRNSKTPNTAANAIQSTALIRSNPSTSILSMVRRSSTSTEPNAITADNRRKSRENLLGLNGVTPNRGGNSPPPSAGQRASRGQLQPMSTNRRNSKENANTLSANETLPEVKSRPLSSVQRSNTSGATDQSPRPNTTMSKLPDVRSTGNSPRPADKPILSNANSNSDIPDDKTSIPSVTVSLNDLNVAKQAEIPIVSQNSAPQLSVDIPKIESFPDPNSNGQF
jgi:hypothetical protein